MQENIPVKLASVPCSIIISITKERGTHLSIVMVPQNGINEGLDTLANGEREEKNHFSIKRFKLAVRHHHTELFTYI
jgi:hypothetical protein